MNESFLRMGMAIGEESVEKLAGSHVAVFGLGGVGGFACEALARCGVGKLSIVDGDSYEITNINRQIGATTETVGRPKTDVHMERILRINPECTVFAHNMFYLPGNSSEIDFGSFDCVIDAVDTVTAKLEIISRASISDVPVISCMGTGNKTDPSRLKIADLSKTSVCPLARVMRKELNLRGIRHLSVVYSDESPLTPANRRRENGRDVPGSLVTVPAVAGMLIASRVISDLIEAAPCRHREEVGKD